MSWGGAEACGWTSTLEQAWRVVFIPLIDGHGKHPVQNGHRMSKSAQDSYTPVKTDVSSLNVQYGSKLGTPVGQVKCQGRFHWARRSPFFLSTGL